MKGKLASGVLTAILVATAPCAAEEVEWRPSGSRSATGQKAKAPSIQLGAARAWNNEPAQPPAVKPASYQPDLLPIGPVIRANGDEEHPVSVGGKKGKSLPKLKVNDPEVIQVKPTEVTPGSIEGQTLQAPPGHTVLWGDGPMLGCGDPCCAPVECDPCCGCPPFAAGPPIVGFGDCYERPRFWFSAEYLYWGFSDPEPPPLIATNQVGTPAGAVGNTFSPFTQVPVGGENFFDGGGSGFRIGAGFWFTRNKLWGMDVSYFFIGQDSDRFATASNGAFIISRPFFPQPQVVADPAFQTGFGLANLAGSVTIDHETYLWGLDANARRALFCGPRYHIDGFLGYRHIQLSDDLRITEQFTVTGAAPGRILIQDRFETRNQFNGAQIGLEAEGHFFRRWFVNGQAKFAMGSVDQTVRASGFQFITPGGLPTAFFPTGVAAAPSNIGRFDRSRFAVASELNIKVGYELTDNWRVFVGYNIMYLSDVVRAAEQVDPVVFRASQPVYPNTPATLAPRPAVLFRNSSFVAQGLNFGLEGRW